MLNPLSSIIGQTKGSGLGAKLAKAGIGSVFLRGANILFGLGLAVLLARTLGPEEYGIYTYVFALISILSIPSQFGMPRLVVRETARAQVNSNWGLMRGLWRWATIWGMLLSFGICLATCGVYFFLAGHFSKIQTDTLLWGLLLLPLIVLNTLRGAALEGLRHVVLGRLPELVLRPTLLALLILICLWFKGSSYLTASHVMALHVAAAAIALIAGLWLLHSNKPKQLAKCPKSVVQSKLWLSAIVPLAITSGLHQINQYTDIMLIGIFCQAADVGIYRVAAQGATFVIIGLQVISMFISPFFAQLHVQGHSNQLYKLLKVSTIGSFLPAILLLLSFVFLGEEIINKFFGAEYTKAYIPLVILGCGQLFNALFGTISLLLNMIGHERDTMSSMIVAAGGNIILNFVLIPIFGVNGAASATAFTFLVWGVSLYVHAKKRGYLSQSISKNREA